MTPPRHVHRPPVPRFLKLRDLLASAGTDVKALCRSARVPRSVLYSAVVAGRVSNKLAQRIGDALGVDATTVRALLLDGEGPR